MKNKNSLNDKSVRRLMIKPFKITLIFISLIIISFNLISCKSKDKINSTQNEPKQVIATMPKSSTRAVFNKSTADITADLKTVDPVVGTAIPVKGPTGAYGEYDGIITYHATTTNLGNVYGVPITATHAFKIVSSVEQKDGLGDWQNLVVYIDADFIVKDNPIVENGTYNAKGNCKIIYKLDTNKNEWVFSSVISDPMGARNYVLITSKVH